MEKPRYHKYIYIFVICCIVGFAVETIWCYVKNGYWESRKSLVYGPFSVAYGMGGVLLTFVLNKFKAASYPKIFFISFLTGTITEYICSLGQEIVFGSVAWDYSHLPLNINGRVCLLYSIFWGALGIVWVKLIMPLFGKITDKVPYKISRVLVIGLTAFFVFDAVVSASAAIRMNERENGLEPSNYYEVFLDSHFPDERMKKIYANSQEVQ